MEDGSMTGTKYWHPSGASSWRVDTRYASTPLEDESKAEMVRGRRFAISMK